MRIMVFDVPAESGGALSVLYDFYNEYKLDESNEYIFVISIPKLVEARNIKVIRYPWIKKSWIHRLYFDYIIAPKLVTNFEVDKILSLQNICIPNTKVYQSLFVHNALPFSSHRFRFKENKILWIYQNIIGRNIKKSIEMANDVIVQTNWMKDKLIEQLNVDTDKIQVKKPQVSVEIKEYFKTTKKSLSTFFYPASGVVFKNHQVIIDACIKLKKEGINDYRVIFTLNGDENKFVEELYNSVKRNKLPIEFLGTLERDKVFQLYSESILIFPSYIETVGLPLLEAKKHLSPVIASKSDYGNEILKGYDDVVWFDYKNHNELYYILKEKIYFSKGVVDDN